MNETVLYYTPAKSPQTMKLKGVLVRMGIRIKNIAPEQTHQKIGFLVGIDGYTKEDAPNPSLADDNISEEMLVLHQFSERRLNELLANLRKAGVRIALKAIVTESNTDWTFLELYQELKEEHAAMMARAALHFRRD